MRTHLAYLVLLAALAGCAPAVTPPAPRQDMLFVEAGEFIMGSEIGFSDEQPAHPVYLDGFWIDRTETTNAMYRRCVEAGACREPSPKTYFDNPDYADHPVVSVSWEMARAYCAWAGRRLPTEAEWEKAASWDPAAGQKRIYPWGDEFDCKRGNFGGADCDGYEATAPAGSFLDGASAYGALDMAGNAWEWVNDAFLETDPFGERPNYYAVSPYANPSGEDPALSEYRVMRGGAWTMNFGGGRSAYRLWFGLDDAYNFAGFRCADGGG